MNKTKQRGSGWSVKLALRLYQLFGYRFIYYLLYPITLVYAVLSRSLRKPLADYYKHHNIELTYKLFFEHLRVFAITMVDRFITKIDAKSYQFIFDDYEKQVEMFSRSTILVLSHFGGWAAASNASRSDIKINIVMQEVLNEGIKEIENSLGMQSNLNVICLNKGQIAASIEIANALMKDEVVAIMGDRASNSKSNIACEFLGEKAYFNKNPFKIAYKMEQPIVAYFVILVGIQQYKVECIEIAIDTTMDEEDAIYKAMNEYVGKYEEVLRKHPSQWLNFYDFWKK